MDNFEHFMGMIEKGGIGGGRIDIVLSCVDNFQARRRPLPILAHQHTHHTAPPTILAPAIRSRPTSPPAEHRRG